MRILKNITGIGPDRTIEQGDNTEQEQKLVRDVLISAYDKNISTRLKAELCSLDVNNYNYTKDASISKSLLFYESAHYFPLYSLYPNFIIFS